MDLKFCDTKRELFMDIRSGNEYAIDKLYYSESQYNSNNELEVQYIANGTSYSEEEFNNDMSHQGEKSNVKWYDLTPGNVESAF